MKITLSLARAVAAASATLLVVLTSASPASAQGASLTGRVTRDTGEAMDGAAVVLEELRREARTAADGTYRFDDVPPGTYHINVRAEGYSTHRTEVVVTPEGATLDLVVELDLHFNEVVSVSPAARSQFESYQPTSVLAGQELQKELEATIGATLQAQPGVAMRAFGPAPARPVIRGLDGDRIAVLEDGQRAGDLSSQSADHGVNVNPSSAQRIEVVRGPATLLYGANAIGGLVNVITNQIPRAPLEGVKGDFTLDAATNAGETGGSGEVSVGNGRVAMNIGAYGRRAGEFSTPAGEVENSQLRNSGLNIGVSATREKTYVGGSYVFDDSKYGVPFVEGGEISLTPRRHAFTVRAGGEGLDGAISSYRGTLGIKRYEHDELEGDEVGTHFDNDTEEAELLVSHRPFGRLAGTVGGWFLNRGFTATGEEALAPPVDQRTGAIFLYEELTWPHVTVQFGGRLDRTSFSAEGGLPDRDFTEFSGSAGLLFRPVQNNDDLVVALSLARAARNPALEELYFFGPHPGNLAFEIGNPGLGAERAIGFDVSLRARSQRVHGEITAFRNGIDDFIFRNPISEEEFEAREEEFDARFGAPGGAGVHAHDEEFPFVEFVGADAALWGIEGHVDVQLTPSVAAEFTYDMVRGGLRDSAASLPRIPPQRFITGLRYQRNALQVGGNLTLIGDQNRVFGEETPTEGAMLLKLFGSYSFAAGGVTNTITLRLDNATNELYRNHLNYLKDVLPEMGRNLKAVYSVSF